MPGEKELRLTEDGIRSALQSIFSRVPYLQWYSGSLAARGKLSPRVLSAEGAADDFLARAGSEDISPVRFFDPVWFRGRYRVDGVNAFPDYRALLTPETAERIHALYARDFETYGYSPALR